MQLTTLRRDERGIALPTAIFALVVIGALVAGIFFTARIEVRSGENTMSEARATEAAQGGLLMGYPNVLTIAGALTNGGQAGTPKTQIGTSGSYYTDSVTQLNRYMFLLRSFGTYEVNGQVVAARTLAMLIKRYIPEMNLQAGATVVGTPVVKGSAVIDGNDHVPPGWTGCTLGAAVPGVRTNSTDTNNIQKASNIVTGTGTPDIVGGDTSVSNLKNVLDTMFYQLAAEANVIYHAADGATITANPNPAGTGTCIKTDTTNWGDPGRASPANGCENWFPIVYVSIPLGAGGTHGSVKLHAYGQGVLLINGDMELNAGSVWNGLILLRGDFGKANGDATITGGVVAQNADLDVNGAGVQGNLSLNYSSCAISTALKNLSVASPSTYRGFIQY